MEFPQTIKGMLTRSVERFGGRVAFRYKENRQWREVTYREFQRRVWCVSEMLAECGVKPGDRVAIFAENSAEWPAMYFGILGLNATAVPVDAKLKEQEVAHILRDSDAGAALSTNRQYPILRDIQPGLPSLDHIILLQGRSVLPTLSDGVSYHVYEERMDQAMDKARLPDRAYDLYAPKPDDIASFIYTSGTTGRQKGAMLSHRNFMANVQSCTGAIDISPDENFLLVLPLHHAFAFTGNLLVPLALGNEISLVESLRTVGENVREVSPSAFIGVPLLIEKMYERIVDRLKQNKIGYALYRTGIRGPVRKRIRESLGGRLRIVITGGAPCNPDVLRGFAEFGIQILEGYGLTETGPVCSLNPWSKPKPGTIGLPLPDVEIKIDEPDAEGVGELLIRGPNVMKGYFNNPTASEDAFRDGWFCTGDLGCVDEEGYFAITGRKKSLIVNREGKNIYPEEVEHYAVQSPYILEALVLGYHEPGEKIGERVGLIVVPNQETLDEEAARTGTHRTDREVIDLLREEVKRTCQAITEYKRPRKILVRMEAFEKTSTGKIKRYLYDLESTDL